MFSDYTRVDLPGKKTRADIYVDVQTKYGGQQSTQGSTEKKADIPKAFLATVDLSSLGATATLRRLSGKLKCIYVQSSG